MSTRMESLREAAAQLAPAEEEAAPVEEVTEVEAPPADEPAAEVDAAPDEEPAPAKEEKPDRARDESGKFAKAPKTKAPAPDKAVAPAPAVKTPAVKAKGPGNQSGGGQSPAPASPPPPPAPKFKAPQSWTPAARERWNVLPPEIQAEIDRREREASTGLQSHAERAKQADAFEQVVAPYRAMLGNLPAPQAFAGLLQAQHVLTHGTPAQKAQGIAQIINQSGIDLELINGHLGGKAAPAGQPQSFDPQQIAQQVREQVLGQITQQRQQAIHQQTQQELATFGQTHEFYEDVRQDMADLLESAARRRVAMTPEQAYTRACKLNEDVSKVLEQREAAKRAKALNASTQRAKNASSSVKSEPASAASGDKPTDRLSMLRQAAAGLK